MRNAILTGLLCAASSAALAQNAGGAAGGPAQPGADPGTTNQLQQVVVTGTLIRGEAAPIGSQLTTIGTAEIGKTGTTNTADILATVPMLNSFNIAPQGGQSEFNSGGSSTPGLHGLPGTATLVLIDGHRAVGDTPLLTVPDPSSIPAVAISNIQVLADGGSAIYGSDAVAGVINLILQTHYNGEKTVVSGGIGNAYNTASIQQLFGRTWHGGSFMIAGSYEGNSDLKNKDRSFYQFAPAGLQYVKNYNCPDPNVEIGNQAYGGPGLTPGPMRACDPNANADMFDQQRRYAVVTTVRQDLGSRVRLSFDGKYTDQLTKEQTGMAAIATGHDSSGRPVVTLPSTNPYFFQPPGGTATSENVLMSSASFGSLGNIYDVFRSKSGMADFGALVDLGGSWNLDADFDYSWSSSSTLNSDYGGGNLSAIGAAAAATSPSAALNPFGDTNPAVVSSILNWPLYFLGDQSLYWFNVKANGNLFKLPAGHIKLALGAAAGRENYSGSNPIGISGQPGYNNNYVNASRRNTGVFGELAIPVVGSANAIPGVRKLDFSVAARYDHYSDFGNTTNPKFGINWYPIRGLKILASYGTSFHAPQLADDFGIDTRAGGGGPGSPPPGYVLPPGTPYTTAYIAGGRAGLQPETADTTTFGFDWSPQFAPGFKATMSYFMIRFKNQVEIPPPSQLFTTPALMSRFVYLNPTGNPANPLAPLTPAQIASIFNGIRLTGLLATTPFPPLYQVIDLRRANIGSTSVNGLDFNFTYQHPITDGQLLAGLSGEYLSQYQTNEGPGTPWQDNLTNGNSYLTSDTSAYNVIPWHVRGTLGWQIGPDFLTQAYVNYTGHYSWGYVTSQGAKAKQWVGSFLTVDWLGQYYFPGGNKFTHGLRLQLNVDNVFNERPPLVMVTNGFVQESANPLGRFFQLTLSKSW